MPRVIVRSIAISFVLTGVCFTAQAPPAIAQTAPAVAALMQNRSVSAALDTVRRGEPHTLDEQARFCETPAPPFKEAARAELLRRAFLDAGLEHVRVDEAGNVLGDRPGARARPRLVVAAHLDTVFGEGIPVRVTRQPPMMRGPGIGDNCRGLAVLVSVARALQSAGVRTAGPITFVADVGEEGLGDLRGMKALFRDTLKGQIDRFVSLDGPGLFVTTVGVGSLRYRVTFKGPGGHSFSDFGQANPIGALGRAIAAINAIEVPSEPKTTFNVGRVGGGTSVNAIPAEAWMEVDLRSSDPAALAALDAKFHAAVDAALRDENRRGRRASLTVTKETVGDRPAGVTAPDAPIVQTARAAAQALGLDMPIAQGSTDANLPMSLGIPAITIGAGGRGSDAHAVTESFDSTNSWRGTQVALLVTVALAND